MERGVEGGLGDQDRHGAAAEMGLDLREPAAIRQVGAADDDVAVRPVEGESARLALDLLGHEPGDGWIDCPGLEIDEREAGLPPERLHDLVLGRESEVDQGLAESNLSIVVDAKRPLKLIAGDEAVVDEQAAERPVTWAWRDEHVQSVGHDTKDPWAGKSAVSGTARALSSWLTVTATWTA
jgi:hypothetical protein